MDWLRRRKDDHRTLDQYLKYQVPDVECRIYAARQKDFVLRHNLLYLRVMPKRSNEDVLAFVVPGLKRQAVCTVSFKSICRSGANPEKVLRIRRGAMQVYHHNQ